MLGSVKPGKKEKREKIKKNDVKEGKKTQEERSSGDNNTKKKEERGARRKKRPMCFDSCRVSFSVWGCCFFWA